MQKWHNRKIHGDVLWRGWHFWPWKFHNPRDRTTDSKIKCRKNVPVPGKLYSFQPSCCNRTLNWLTEYDCWFIDELTSSSSAAAAAVAVAVAPASISLFYTYCVCQALNRRPLAWQIDAYPIELAGRCWVDRLTGYLFQALTAFELFRAWLLSG